MILANFESLGTTVCVHYRKTEVLGRIARVTGSSLNGYFSTVYVMTPHGTMIKSGTGLVFSLIDDLDEENLRKLEGKAEEEKGMAYPGFSSVISLYHPDHAEEAKKKLPKPKKRGF